MIDWYSLEELFKRTCGCTGPPGNCPCIRRRREQVEYTAQKAGIDAAAAERAMDAYEHCLTEEFRGFRAAFHPEKQ